MKKIIIITILVLATFVLADTLRVTSTPPLRLVYSNGSLHGSIDIAAGDPCRMGVISYSDWYTFDNKLDFESDPCFVLWQSTYDANESDPCFVLWQSTYDANESDPCFVASPAWNITDANITDWQTAYTDRLKWDGGSTGLVAATGRTSLELSTTDSPSFDDLTLTGALNIPTTTSTVGQIIQNSIKILHTYVWPDGTNGLNPTWKNVFIGSNAGNFTLTNGGVNAFDGTGNVALGANALDALTTGYFNFGIGTAAGGAITTGHSNVFIGHQAGLSQVGASFLVMIGRDAGAIATSGVGSVGIGYDALRNCTGSRTVGVGFYAGRAATSCDMSIFLGPYAGYRQTTADNILLVSNQDHGSAAAELTNSIIYGVMAAAPANQTLNLNANVGIQKTTAPTVALDVAGSTILGSASTDTITCTGRWIPRTVGADPTSSATAGTLGEIVFYNNKWYGKTVDTGTNTNWSALN